MRDQKKCFYIRDENRFPVACVVAETPTTSPDVVLFAVSTWNPLDNFDKKRGREIAEGRLAKRRNGFVTAGPGVKKRILQQLATDDWYPKRLRRAARLMLDDLLFNEIEEQVA